MAKVGWVVAVKWGERGLDVSAENLLDELRDGATVRTVTVTDGEEELVLVLAEVGGYYVTVLIPLHYSACLLSCFRTHSVARYHLTLTWCRRSEWRRWWLRLQTTHLFKSATQTSVGRGSFMEDTACRSRCRRSSCLLGDYGW